MTSSTTTAVRPLPFKATGSDAGLLPTSVRGAPPELRRLIRKRQNSESAKRCRLRRKLEAQKEMGTAHLTSNQQLEQLQQLVHDLASRLVQTQDIVAALVAHAQHNVLQTQALHKAAAVVPPQCQYQMPQNIIPNMQPPCKQEASMIAPPQIIQVQGQEQTSAQPMQHVIQQQATTNVPAPMAPVPVMAQEQQKQALQPAPLADLADLQYQQTGTQQQQPGSPACSSSTISTIENHLPNIMVPAPNNNTNNNNNAPQTGQEEVGSPFSDLNEIGTDFVYSVDLRDLGNEAYNL